MNKKIRHHLTSSSSWAIVLVLATTPLVFHGAGVALGQRDNQVRQWLPRGFAETQRYDWFLKHFGSEEFSLVSWENAFVDDDRMTTLAHSLRKYVPSSAATLPQSSDEGDTRPGWFRKIVTGPELLATLQNGKLNLSEASARNRLRGSLIGPDGRTTGMLILLNDEGRQNRHGVVAAIRAEATKAGISAADLRLGGPTIDSVALDQESERSRYQLAIISLALGTLAAWKCLHQIRLVAVVIFSSLYCSAATLAWVALFGDKLNLVMVSMPTLVYVLTISGAIHVTHYYRAALRNNNSRDAVRVSLKAGWLPCTLTAVTTAVGLGSLMISNVNPVRLFGFYSTLGILTSLPVVLFFIPAVLALVVGTDNECEPSRKRENTWLTDRLSEIVARRHNAIVVVGVLLMLLSLTGLSRLESSVKLTNFFAPESRVIADYRWLEQKLAPLVPIEIVLQLPNDEQHLRLVDRIDLTERVQRALADLPEVEGAISAATFAPPIPSGGGFRQVVKRQVIDKELRQNRDQLFSTGYVGIDGNQQLWRVSARVNALNDLDYGIFLDTLRATVEPVLADVRAAHPDLEPIDAVYTGVVPLIYKAQRVLLDDLTKSFLLAFALIALVMLMLMKGPAAGLISMLPNLFPAVVVFGSLGWMGIVCDIGTVITASVALGIAVDDTIHFMSWFRRGLEAGMSRLDAVRNSYRRCGVAMIQTTAICGLGMLGFAFSGFPPTAKFATLMSVLLVAALVGDLLFLPAILTSRLGRVFETSVAPRPKRRRFPSPTTESRSLPLPV